MGGKIVAMLLFLHRSSRTLDSPRRQSKGPRQGLKCLAGVKKFQRQVNLENESGTSVEPNDAQMQDGFETLITSKTITHGNS